MTFEADKVLSSSIPANAVAVTPADATDLSHVAAALYIGTGEGDVKVDMEGVGSAVVFKNLPTGAILPGRITRVYSTDTTASNIVALY